MKKLILAAVCLMFAFTFMAPVAADAAPETILRFAGQVPPEHPATGYMNEIAKEVLEKTNGRIEIKVYPANQLGDYTLVYQELIRGTIDMAMISIPGDIDPRVNFVYTNGLAWDYKQLADFFEPGAWAYKKMDELNQNLGVKFLGFHPEGFIGLSSTKPLVEPLNPKVDKGVLCRVPNMQVYKDGAEAMGFRTVTIPYSDLYVSMQTGVCDAVDGIPPQAAYTILKDVMKYWYQLNYSMEVFPAMMSMKTWAKLSDADKKIIEEACARTSVLSVQNAERDDNAAMELMKKQGIEVNVYTAEELSAIREAVIASWPKLNGTWGKDFVDEMIAAVSK
ncbi:TRAP transporter substrate-binding protein DctP [Synergistaceae bacterium OttesenSCG-928-I11]|nr:TRAP transporter substrate-binding protein DctP [Synergistaceae bacterium OttesenSCG-928-I11]